MDNYKNNFEMIIREFQVEPEKNEGWGKVKYRVMHSKFSRPLNSGIIKEKLRKLGQN